MNGDQWDVRDRSQHDPAGVLRLLRDLRSCDLAFSWGGRLDMGPFLRAAKFLRTPDVVIFWCGSDVLRSTELRKRAAPDPWILKQIHWAASESLAGEVRSLGVDCEFVQSSFVPRIKDPAPLPETFSVTVYLPAPKLADLYGWNIVSNVARSLPHINFNLVGLREGTLDAPPNVRIHPWIADLTLVYRQSTVLWRPVRHDAGISFMVLEALSHGRHVLYSYPVPGAVQARDAREAAFHLQHLFELHSAGLLPLNRAGIDAVARVYSREVVREELRRRWAGNHRRQVKKACFVMVPTLATHAAIQEPGILNIPASASVPLSPVAPRSKASRTVLVHGLVYFGRAFADFMNGDGWSFHYYPDSGARNLLSMARCLRSCDLVYQVGGRVTIGKFLRAARFFEKSKFVMHWVGSDTLDEQRDVARGLADPWVLRKIHHWAESDWMVREVNALGVPCERVPLPSPLVPDAPSAVPRDFRVLVYVPTVTRAGLYGLQDILQVVNALPHISFDLVGLRDGPLPDCPANLTVYGRIPNLREFYRNCSVVWRPARHDGVSWMVMEALGHGRHVLWTYPFPGCLHVTTAEQARNQIASLHELHCRGLLRINEAGFNFMSRGPFHPQRSRLEIRTRLEKILAY